MDNLKKFFQKKKNDYTFVKAGVGHRLNEEPKKNKIQSSSSANVQQPRPVRTTGADPNVTQAMLNRLEAKNNQNKKSTLYDIMNEEKQKIYKEMQLKDELEKQRNEAAKLRASLNENPYKEFEESQLFTCKTLDLNKPVPFKELKCQLKSSLFDNFQDDNILRSIMIMFNCNRSMNEIGTEMNQKLRTGTEILIKIITNLMTEDLEELKKFKRIRRSKIEQKVLNLDGALDFLYAIGFTIDQDDLDWLVYTDDGDQEIRNKMSYLKDLLSTPQIIPIELERQVRLFQNDSQAESSTDLSDDYIQASSKELKQYYDNLRRYREINEMFVSQKTKLRMISSNNLSHFKPLFTRLRFKIHFNNEMLIIEAIFLSKEKLSEIKTWFLAEFGDVFHLKSISFKHCTTLLSEENSDLETLGLSPASTLLVI
ncbi:UBX domain-containing protein 6 [Sarcoptes scabiei]|uniref:UBX domain-containing protein 6 n=1 Tax=Sarcoptes scabiei TaxID=52283 RepID=A0A834R4X0_SARSC|nr:UBX domain-containing protein 6 [Sarcoptes scabiei]